MLHNKILVATMIIVAMSNICSLPVVAENNNELTNLHRVHINTKNFRYLNGIAIDKERTEYNQVCLAVKRKDMLTQQMKANRLSEESILLASAGGEKYQGYSIKDDTNTNFTIEQMNDNKDAVIKIDKPDPRYMPYKISLPDDQRDLLERLVTGEAGSTYEGSLLVAQCIRDAIVCDGYKSIPQIRKALRYTGSIYMGKSEHAIRAVHEIFDEGKCAIQHRVYYFYAPALVKSKWHETQYFLLDINGHRYFDRVTDINSHKMLTGEGGMIVLPETPVKHFEEEQTDLTTENLMENAIAINDDSLIGGLTDINKDNNDEEQTTEGQSTDFLENENIDIDFEDTEEKNLGQNQDTVEGENLTVSEGNFLGSEEESLIESLTDKTELSTVSTELSTFEEETETTTEDIHKHTGYPVRRQQVT